MLESEHKQEPSCSYSRESVGGWLSFSHTQTHTHTYTQREGSELFSSVTLSVLLFTISSFVSLISNYLGLTWHKHTHSISYTHTHTPLCPVSMTHTHKHTYLSALFQSYIWRLTSMFPLFSTTVPHHLTCTHTHTHT